MAQTAEERFLEAVLDLGKERGWRHPSVDESLPIQRLSWPRFEPSIEPNVWEKHSGMLSLVLAVVAPDWGLRQVQPDWLERYGPRESRIALPLWDRGTKASPGSGGQRRMEPVGGD